VRLAIGIPAYGGRVSSGHVFQAGNIAAAWTQSRMPPPYYIHTDTCAVDKARNMLVAKARDAKCDWLLMCDADTYYPVPAAIAAMIHEGQSRGAAVIAAPVRMRKRDGYNVKRGDELVPIDDIRGRVAEVDAIGTAFMAVRLGWIAKEWPLSPWFRFIHNEGYQPSTTGEDYAFCQGVKQRGGVILADARFEPVHVGASDESGMAMSLGVESFDA
jgi:hypothetical protein